MKKHFIAFMMPFLTLATGFAQEAAQDVPVKQDTKEISYWTGSTHPFLCIVIDTHKLLRFLSHKIGKLQEKA